MTEWLHFHFSLSCIGEGNGNPLQCSCLKNPRDSWAWWAAIYGVTQSWTWLKRLSSSSSSNVSYNFSFFICEFIDWGPLPFLLDAGAAVKSLQSCLTLCDPIDGSPPGSAVPGILQARTLEWVAISFSNAWKWKVKEWKWSHSVIRLFATPWTAAYQALPSMGFSRQEYWSGLQFPSPFFSMSG